MCLHVYDVVAFLRFLILELPVCMKKEVSKIRWMTCVVYQECGVPRVWCTKSVVYQEYGVPRVWCTKSNLKIEGAVCFEMLTNLCTCQTTRLYIPQDRNVDTQCSVTFRLFFFPIGLPFHYRAVCTTHHVLADFTAMVKVKFFSCYYAWEVEVCLQAFLTDVAKVEDSSHLCRPAPIGGTPRSIWRPSVVAGSETTFLDRPAHSVVTIVTELSLLECFVADRKRTLIVLSWRSFFKNDLSYCWDWPARSVKIL
jgi:hypothetical protein